MLANKFIIGTFVRLFGEWPRLEKHADKQNYVDLIPDIYKAVPVSVVALKSNQVRVKDDMERACLWRLWRYIFN